MSIDEALSRAREAHDHANQAHEKIEDVSRQLHGYVSWDVLKWIVAVMGFTSMISVGGSAYFKYVENERLTVLEQITAINSDDRAEIQERLSKVEKLARASTVYNQIIAEKLGVNLPSVD